MKRNVTTLATFIKGKRSNHLKGAHLCLVVHCTMIVSRQPLTCQFTNKDLSANMKEEGGILVPLVGKKRKVIIR